MLYSYTQWKYVSRQNSLVIHSTLRTHTAYSIHIERNCICAMCEEHRKNTFQLTHAHCAMCRNTNFTVFFSFSVRSDEQNLYRPYSAESRNKNQRKISTKKRTFIE